MNRKPKWVSWFDRLDKDDKRTVALGAIERLMELEEVQYREEEDDNIDEDDNTEDCVYWTESGESLVIPF